MHGDQTQISNPANPTRLVARFLLAHGYLDTLQTLADESNIRIADLHLDDVEGEDITLEGLLEERRLRELSVELAKTRLAESEISGWTELCYQDPIPLPIVAPTNVLFVTVETVADCPCILVATADKAMRLYDFNSFELKQELRFLHSSPILEARVVGGQYLFTAGMDGKVVVTDLKSEEVVLDGLDQRHQRYVNRLVLYEQNWIATSGYDKKINLYEITECTSTTIKVELRASITLPSLPEGLLFCKHLDALALVVCARDTCFLEYYLVPSLELQTRINMNANKDLWISFSGIDISQQPGGPRYIGLSTSTTPNGRWLAFKVGEDEMKANVFHGAPQSDLGVLPRHVWRPDGSGFWGRSLPWLNEL
ncbi:Predicted protein [Taphrina deformans PYCC 5710]|uniref:Uncharacterized protein n=1 Tax=Taphrina deformans (strain PYCC 5710 / ATCC 11124 / CBS 356.35 / IMI 108563 / JCM 9778 / NBRC 8474) TaxID=1097556 RepID=R4XAQ7_TAPDE|nr:Predicted protein [Taphrina deformans PYCC 5710]|eukprot:CCG82604.1 Predicted protein [Taphrina deformans PYCC 5710]